MRDQGQELLTEAEVKSTVLSPILGLLQTKGNNDEAVKTNNIEKNIDEKPSNTAGRLVIYGDSNCIDDSHLQKRMYIALNYCEIVSVK